MAPLVLGDLPEVFPSTPELARAITRAARRGEVRRVAPRIYSTNLDEPLETVVRRNLWPLVGLVTPGAVVGYRTSLDGRPTDGGTVFVSGGYDRISTLPGLRVRQIAGPGPLEGDTPFVGTLVLASSARAYLQCLSFERIRGSESPGLARAEVEARLERVVAIQGEARARRLRDLARRVAPALGAERAFELLDAILGALLRTRPARLESRSARARAAGEPYDPARLELFQQLHAELLGTVPSSRPDPIRSGPAWTNLAFVDAYFSNFIEGTELELDEAAAIVLEGRIPRSRPEDAHDILGTFRVVSSPEEMSTSVADLSFDELAAVLQRRHARILEGRPDKRPGEWKITPNRAGSSVFVEPELVLGTMRQGYELTRSLTEPFQRAVLMMFVIAEVHPFDDGNGRLARATMNAELVAGGERRVLIPISYREDYLFALRALSRTRTPVPIVRMVDRAQAYTAAIDFTDLREALAVLERTAAFERDPDARLRLPDELPR